MKFNNPKGLDEKCSNIYQLKKNIQHYAEAFGFKSLKQV